MRIPVSLVMGLLCAALAAQSTQLRWELREFPGQAPDPDLVYDEARGVLVGDLPKQ